MTRKIRQGVGLDPAPNPRKTGRGRPAPWHDVLVELIHQGADITLKELQGAPEHAHGVRASVPGIDRALERLGCTYKKEPHCG